MKYITTILVFLLFGAAASGQLRIVRAGTHSGYAAVSSASLAGHVVAGIPVAERVEGASLSGWIGFMPVKRDRPTSVTEQSRTQGIAHPNPANDVVRLPDVEPSARVTVLDQRGRTVNVEIERLESAIQLRTASLENGVYYVSIMWNQTSTMHRFVIQR